MGTIGPITLRLGAGRRRCRRHPSTIDWWTATSQLCSLRLVRSPTRIAPPRTMTRKGPTKPSMIQRWREFGRRVNVRYLEFGLWAAPLVMGGWSSPFFFFFPSWFTVLMWAPVHACLSRRSRTTRSTASMEGSSGQTWRPSRRKHDARSGLAPADTLGLCTASGSSGYEWATAWVPTLAC